MDVNGLSGKFFSVIPYQGKDGNRYFDVNITNNTHIGHGITSPENAPDILGDPSKHFHLGRSEEAKKVW